MKVHVLWYDYYEDSSIVGTTQTLQLGNIKCGEEKNCIVSMDLSGIVAGRYYFYLDTILYAKLVLFHRIVTEKRDKIIAETLNCHKSSVFFHALTFFDYFCSLNTLLGIFTYEAHSVFMRSHPLLAPIGASRRPAPRHGLRP